MSELETVARPGLVSDRQGEVPAENPDVFRISGETKSPGENASVSATNSGMNDAERFAALFRGLDRSRGVYNGVATTPNEKGKLLGSERKTNAGTVTIEHYREHLAGASGLGIVPIMSDNTVLFGAIDVDIYANFRHDDLVNKLGLLNLPLIVCRSKSGGAHCYLFAAEPVPAALMVNKLKEIAAMLGHSNAEIFPKQKTIKPDEEGSWINLPYFDGMMTARYAVGPDGPMSPEEFLAYAEARKQSTEWFDKPMVHSIDLPQGPPCLQHLVQIGFPQGTRNSGLFNLGVYCRKADPDNWKAMLEEMNQKYMQPPLASNEVQDVIKSVGRKTYFYKCSDQPIAAHCDKALCRTRQFGIGAGGALPEFGPLKKILTDPPTWVWTVNNSPITLSTDQLLEPWLFKKAGVREFTLDVHVRAETRRMGCACR